MSNFARCAACRYLRRRCCEDCPLAPFFPSTNPTRFAYVHRVFGASNVSRMLQVLYFYAFDLMHCILQKLISCEHIQQQIPPEQRRQAADAIALEAYWRVQNPVYGSVGVISMLQREINTVQRELAETQAHVALYAARAQSPTAQFDQ